MALGEVEESPNPQSFGDAGKWWNNTSPAVHPQLSHPENKLKI
jgi:hypothetical protein